MTASAPANLPSRYQLFEVIGEGGMGRVYRAHDSTLHRDVAIKVIERERAVKESTQQRERFVREARAAARLDHPNIVAVHDVDADAGWLVMALVEGTTLKELPLPGPRVRAIARQVLEGLMAAHAAGVIHRDIKPSNIIVDEADRVTLVDFGVARLMDGEMTKTGESLGTPAYMAPEQLRGATVDARTDLYGLGATLYEVVTGEKMIAFESPGPQALAKVRTACSDDAGLARLIEACLQADPAARPQTAREALAVLTSRVRRVPWKLIALVVALAIAGVAVFVLTRKTTTDARFDQAFMLSQHGEHERADQVLQGYLAEHPDDADALTLQLLISWWQGGVIDEPRRRAADSKLRPPQRALVQGIDLIVVRREAEAVGFLTAAEKDYPDTVEIVFALGEAQWHARQYDEAVVTLERAFTLDPRWQMALHHIIEFRLSRGEAAKLEPIAALLRDGDAPAAAALDCSIAIGKRDYAGAVRLAEAGIARDPSAELYICLSQAQAIRGDLVAGEAAATKAYELWPVDLREWGGFAHRAEYKLYRGQLDEYVSLLGQKPSRQRAIAQSLWRPDPSVFEASPVGLGMRMPPLGAAAFVLIGWSLGRDEVAAYGEYPEVEVRELGKGLWAEKRGDLVAAVMHYRRSLAVLQKGDIKMLVSHALARVSHLTGRVDDAKTACREVIEPMLYQAYRAVVLPDCVIWSGDPARIAALRETWRGATFEHPALRQNSSVPRGQN